ncbi:hypothetical protein ACFPRL_32925 [Pseudoclavibacter helvolus]
MTPAAATSPANSPMTPPRINPTPRSASIGVTNPRSQPPSTTPTRITPAQSCTRPAVGSFTPSGRRRARSPAFDERRE